MIKFLKSKTFILLFAGAIAGVVLLSVSAKIIIDTSTTDFCMSCHEMRIVAQQGWMKSPHYKNEHGVVAQCADCHIEPELLPMLWTKTRDGLTDIWVHNLGESDPHKMDWERLVKIARSHVKDSSCKKCHNNYIPDGGDLKMIMAHRAYDKMNGRKKCIDCHTDEFHGEFKKYLFDAKKTDLNGGQ